MTQVQQTALYNDDVGLRVLGCRVDILGTALYIHDLALYLKLVVTPADLRCCVPTPPEGGGRQIGQCVAGPVAHTPAGYHGNTLVSPPAISRLIRPSAWSYFIFMLEVVVFHFPRV